VLHFGVWAETLALVSFMQGLWRRGLAWLSPPVAADIMPALRLAQFDSIRRDVPTLLRVAAINMSIIIAACINDDLPFTSYGWMFLLVGYCLFRSRSWTKILSKPVTADQIPRLVRRVTITTIVIISGLGVEAAISFVRGIFDMQMLIPISLCLGTMAIAHCLYAVRSVALITLIMGVMPSGAAMILFGDFQAQLIGGAMISVNLLMLRFVAGQYEQLLARLALEKRNAELAYTDPLTGLANRRAVMAALAEAVSQQQPFALALVDLDGFKQANDSFGHSFGDQLLCTIADRMRSSVAATDLVGRLGGDEFVLLLNGVADAAQAAARCDAILLALCRPVDRDGRPLPVGASIGFAVAGGEDATVESLLHRADQALYAMKRTRPATRTVSALAS
jgi:diguanylate cyclase (GGDEF)-like protein